MSQVETLAKIYQQYMEWADFYLIYIREAHPGGEIEQPDTWEKRREIARSFVNGINFPIPTLIDRIDNKTESDYMAWPDRIYIVGKDGKVVYKGAKGPGGFEPLQIVDVLETSAEVDPSAGLVVTWGILKASL
jgi:hypothetical protein